MSQAVEIDSFLESHCPYCSGTWRGFLVSRLTYFNERRDILSERRAERTEIASRFAKATLPIHEMIAKGFNADEALTRIHCDDSESYRAVLTTVLRHLLELACRNG